MKVKSLSHVQLLATPWTAAYQAPPSMGFSRHEYWSGVPLPSLTEMGKESTNYRLAAAAHHTPPQTGTAHLVPSHLQGTHLDQTGPSATGPRWGDEVGGSRLPSPGNTWHHRGRAPLPRSHTTSHTFGNPGRPGGRGSPHVLAVSTPHETALIGKHLPAVQMPQCWTAGRGFCPTDRLTHRATQVGRKAPPLGALGP